MPLQLNRPARHSSCSSSNSSSPAYLLAGHLTGMFLPTASSTRLWKLQIDPLQSLCVAYSIYVNERNNRNNHNITGLSDLETSAPQKSRPYGAIEIRLLSLLWTHAQRCVHVIFCRCFFYRFLFFFMPALVGQTAERIFTKLSHVVDISCYLRTY